ncbi:putative ferric-chelate reductase 1 homolog isoform X2 [Venturia canescens]|uniref:putative ferric-chelate reductase 1 homolog isoform X2 n=1 Tax=Venturia canescens TaxID=32260 RepID=UPI001C9C1241|nr:putative ferric-chelate reductase 1 homolog isoform X2 [Venturia canescens]
MWNLSEVEKMRPLLVTSCALLLINLANGYPSGAPGSACSSLVPRHPGGSVQASYPPYQVLAAAGQGRIRLTLGSPQGLPYEGFILVARDTQTGEYVGEFANLPEGAQYLECTPGLRNAVTHTDKQKKQNLEFEWEAPNEYEGTIIFNSTFLQDYETYWVGIESPRITVLRGSIEVMSTTPLPGGNGFSVSNPATPSYFDQERIGQRPVAEDSKDDVFYDGCGETKNCLGSSPGCLRSKDCIAVVSVLVRGEEYIFELMTQQGKWVGVGLSNDSKMGDDQVVECTNEGGTVGLYMSENIDKRNTRIGIPDGAVRMLESSIRDDVIRCKFVRNRETRVQGRLYDLSREPYNLLLGAGSQLKAQGIGYHDIIKTASAQAKMLSDVGELKAASDLYIRIHGGLMLASWIGTASIGILLARYYKQTWVNSPICGKDQWFTWHRFFMLATWSMTLASFVLIFVEIGEWSTETIHASLGVATTLLCFIQPFMAAMRPHPGAPKRSLFNWFHWFVGNAAHICAVVAIFFAVRMTKANLPEWFDWILVAYVVFHVLSHLILTFAGCASDRQDNLRINAFPMKDMHTRSSMGHPDARRDAPHSGLRQVIFGIYAFVIVLFAAVLVVITVLAPIEDTWSSFTDKIANY